MEEGNGKACRFFDIACSEGANKVRKGNAHGRFDQGTGTNTIKQIHFKPQHFTTVDCVERTASRYLPFALIVTPLRRSMVSSTPMIIGNPAMRNSATNRPSKVFAPCKPDHLARLSTRWYLQNDVSYQTTSSLILPSLSEDRGTKWPQLSIPGHVPIPELKIVVQKLTGML